MISTKSVASRRAASNRASKKAQDETLLTAINHGQPWHPTEDKRILGGTCLRLLAVELGRTYYACRIRRINLHQLGRSRPPTVTTKRRLEATPAPELHPALEAYRAKTTPAPRWLPWCRRRWLQLLPVPPVREQRGAHHPGRREGHAELGLVHRCVAPHREPDPGGLPLLHFLAHPLCHSSGLGQNSDSQFRRYDDPPAPERATLHDDGR